MRRGVRAEGAGERRAEGHLHRGRQLEVGGEPEPVPRLQRSDDMGFIMKNLIFLIGRISFGAIISHITLYAPHKMYGTELPSASDTVLSDTLLTAILLEGPILIMSLFRVTIWMQ